MLGAVGGERLGRPGQGDEAQQQRPVDDLLRVGLALGDQHPGVQPRHHRAGVAARRPRGRADGREQARVLVRVGHQGQPAVGQPAGEGEAARAVGGHPDRRRRVAVWAQAHRGPREGEELPVEVDRIGGGEQGPDHAQGLVEASQRPLVGQADRRQVERLARAHAQQEAPLAQVVQGERRLRQNDRVAAHDVGHAQAQAHLGGGPRGGGDDRHRVEPHVRALLRRRPGGPGPGSRSSRGTSAAGGRPTRWRRSPGTRGDAPPRLPLRPGVAPRPWPRSRGARASEAG